MRADKALDGVYIFDFELEGNGASYDFSIWGVSRDKAIYGEELRVQWLSPSGSSFSETVYMKCITPRVKGNSTAARWPRMRRESGASASGLFPKMSWLDSE